MKKENALIFLIIITLTLTSATIRHQEDQIEISISGTTQTLEQAINNDQLKNKILSSTTITQLGHTTDTIYLSVNGVQETLQEALSTDYGLCATSASNYTQPIIFGHSASEIEISINGILITFQEAINNGEFCSYSWYTSSWGSCTKTCGGGTRTRNVYCQTQNGMQVNDDKCSEVKPSTSETCNTAACSKTFSSVCVNNRGIEYCSQGAADAFCVTNGFTTASAWSKTGGEVGTPCSACEIWWKGGKWVNGNCDGYGFEYCKDVTCTD